MPAHDHGGQTGQAGAYSQVISNLLRDPFGNFSLPTNGNVGFNSPQINIPNHSHFIAVQGNNIPHNNTQPTIVLNKIIKVSY
jgi:microcystin-dependent protein